MVGGWSTARPVRFTPGKETRYPLYRRLGGPQDRSWRVWKISPSSWFDHRTVQPVAIPDSAGRHRLRRTLPWNTALKFFIQSPSWKKANLTCLTTKCTQDGAERKRVLRRGNDVTPGACAGAARKAALFTRDVDEWTAWWEIWYCLKDWAESGFVPACTRTCSFNNVCSNNLQIFVRQLKNKRPTWCH